MIIVCPECSTKFDVAAERIPDSGAKVRCARCKTVFLAEKSLSTEKPVPDTKTTVQEETSQSAPKQSPDLPDPGEELPGQESTDFSYDRFQELDAEQEENFSFTAEADEDQATVDFEQAAELEESTRDAFTLSDTTDDSGGPIEKAVHSEDEDFSDIFATRDEPSDDQDFPTEPVKARKSSPLSAIIRILLLLILGILIVGGVLVYMNGPDQLNQVIQQIIGQQVNRPAQSGQIALEDLEGRFIQNEQDGELFLIRGKAVNNYSEPRAAIQVKGVIFDQNGKPLLQKTVFCGNPISDQELRSLSFSELEKIMGNQFGKELSNMKVDSQQAIPFDIIFKELPGNLAEFSVKVTSSKPAAE